MYVGFELRNRNQHAKMVEFDTEIEINILSMKSLKSMNLFLLSKGSEFAKD